MSDFLSRQPRVRLGGIAGMLQDSDDENDNYVDDILRKQAETTAPSWLSRVNHQGSQPVSHPLPSTSTQRDRAENRSPSPAAVVAEASKRRKEKEDTLRAKRMEEDGEGGDDHRPGQYRLRTNISPASSNRTGGASDHARRRSLTQAIRHNQQQQQPAGKQDSPTRNGVVSVGAPLNVPVAARGRGGASKSLTSTQQLDKPSLSPAFLDNDSDEDAMQTQNSAKKSTFARTSNLSPTRVTSSISPPPPVASSPTKGAKNHKMQARTPPAGTHEEVNHGRCTAELSWLAPETMIGHYRPVYHQNAATPPPRLTALNASLCKNLGVTTTSLLKADAAEARRMFLASQEGRGGDGSGPASLNGTRTTILSTGERGAGKTPLNGTLRSSSSPTGRHSIGNVQSGTMTPQAISALSVAQNNTSGNSLGVFLKSGSTIVPMGSASGSPSARRGSGGVGLTGIEYVGSFSLSSPGSPGVELQFTSEHIANTTPPKPKEFQVPDLSGMDPYTLKEKAVVEALSRFRADPVCFGITQSGKLQVPLPTIDQHISMCPPTARKAKAKGGNNNDGDSPPLTPRKQMSTLTKHQSTLSKIGSTLAMTTSSSRSQQQQQNRLHDACLLPIIASTYTQAVDEVRQTVEVDETLDQMPETCALGSPMTTFHPQVAPYEIPLTVAKQHVQIIADLLTELKNEARGADGSPLALFDDVDLASSAVAARVAEMSSDSTSATGSPTSKKKSVATAATDTSAKAAAYFTLPSLATFVPETVAQLLSEKYSQAETGKGKKGGANATDASPANGGASPGQSSPEGVKATKKKDQLPVLWEASPLLLISSLAQFNEAYKNAMESTSQYVDRLFSAELGVTAPEGKMDGSVNVASGASNGGPSSPKTGGKKGPGFGGGGGGGALSSAAHAGSIMSPNSGGAVPSKELLARNMEKITKGRKRGNSSVRNQSITNSSINGGAAGTSKNNVSIHIPLCDVLSEPGDDEDMNLMSQSGSDSVSPNNSRSPGNKNLKASPSGKKGGKGGKNAGRKASALHATTSEAATLRRKSTHHIMAKALKSRNTLPRPAYNRGLCLAARDVASRIGDNKPRIAVRDALSQYGQLTGEVSEYIVFGLKETSDIVEEFILKALKERNDRVLLYPTKLYVGAGWQKHHVYGAVTVILLATGFQEISYIKKHDNLPITELRRNMKKGQMTSDERLYDLNFIPEHYGIKAVSPAAHPVVCGSTVELTLECPPSVTLACTMHEDVVPTGSSGNILIDRMGRTARITALLVDCVPSKLIVYARHPHELVFMKASTVLLRPNKASWDVRVARGTSFPVQHDSFQQLQGELVSPRDGTLYVHDGPGDEGFTFTVKLSSTVNKVVLKSSYGTVPLQRVGGQRRSSLALSAAHQSMHIHRGQQLSTFSVIHRPKADTQLTLWVDDICALDWNVQASVGEENF